jgi:hypothetical protein
MRYWSEVEKTLTPKACPIVMALLFPCAIAAIRAKQYQQRAWQIHQRSAVVKVFTPDYQTCPRSSS